jgi:hypothetical protein
MGGMAAHYVQPSLCLQDMLVYLDGGGGGKRPFRLCQSGNWWGGWARIKAFVTIVVIILEKLQNKHVHQFKSTQGAIRIR